MPRKRGTGLNSEGAARELAQNPAWTDPDDAPELTEEFFARADVFEGEKLVRRGRPPSAAPKRLVSLRLDPAVLEGLRATGPGWQTRANSVLKDWLARQTRADRSSQRAGMPSRKEFRR